MWREHRAKTTGTILGLVVGASILVFGFFSTLFVALCMGLGLYIGMKLDKGETDEFMQLLKHLPERFQH